MSPVSIAQLAAGTVFARDYRISSVLSVGGMGAVYAAEQISTGQPRALKLMLPQLVLDPKLRARFEQEARVGSRIQSEHIVAVTAAGVDEATEAPWLAMELLKGETLATLIDRQGALAVALVLSLSEEVCHAVGAAHAAGVVHRDLKPENIFIAETRRTGAKTMVKVLDFGIAKVFAESKAKETAAVGTPLWMCPEQTARGGKVGPPSDVWAIGLIVFRLLTGKVFWRAVNDDELTDMAQLLREVVLEPIPTASDRAKELGCADALPRGFDGWFARSVTREVAGRYQEASAQMSALREVLAPRVRGQGTDAALDATEPAVAADVPAAPPLRERPPRSAFVYVGGVAIIAALGVGGFELYRAGQRSAAENAQLDSAIATPSALMTAAPSAPSASTTIAPPASATSATPASAAPSTAIADAGPDDATAPAAPLPRPAAAVTDATRARNALAAGDPAKAKSILYKKLNAGGKGAATDDEVTILMQACKQTDDSECYNACKKRLHLP